MKHLILSLMVAVVVSACRSNESEKPAASRGDTTSTVATSAPAPAPPPANEPKLEKLTFDKSTVPGEYEYVGKIVDGARWRDRNGENTLMVTMTEKAGENGTTQEIFGYLYLKSGDSTRLLWKIQDNAENWCDLGRGLVSDIRVVDLDDDGVAENAFVYSIQGNCDVSPVEYKLMMHSGATKYAIRGNSRVDLGNGEKMGGAKNIDFPNAPEPYKAWASKLWDETVR